MLKNKTNHMSAKKITTAKVAEPNPKYVLNQKVFIIKYHKDKPEELIECKVWGRGYREIPILEYGKTIGTQKDFYYDVTFPDGTAHNFAEEDVYPSYTEAARVFAKAFLITLP
jgi:hypothetical protein